MQRHYTPRCNFPLRGPGSKTRVLPHRALRQLADNDASMNTIAAKPPDDWPVDRQKDKFHNLEKLASYR
jgi:hypothetical protein